MRTRFLSRRGENELLSRATRDQVVVRHAALVSMDSSPVTVFLDPDQGFRSRENTRIADIDGWANELGRRSSECRFTARWIS
jgi:hypothetical protein